MLKPTKSSLIGTCAQEQEEARCDQVRVAVSKRELDVLNAFADGLDPQQVADRLGISIKTVNTHETEIFNHCRTVWSLPSNTRLEYHFLHKKFAKLGGENECNIQSMVQVHQRKFNIDEYKCCIRVIDASKKHELDVLNAFADGLDPQQVADRLNISKKTVDTYKTILLKLCRTAWKLSPTEKPDYQFLNTKFAGFSSQIQHKMRSLYYLQQ